MSCRSVKRAVQYATFLLLASATAPPGVAQFAANHYILVLADPPVSEHFATRQEMETSAAKTYRQQIETRQRNVMRELESRKIRVTGSVSTFLNDIFVTAPPERLDELKSIPGVIAVLPQRRGRQFMNRAAQLMNAPAAWNLLGGTPNAGKGIKIAILDTGIDQNHPAFQDSTLTMPPGFPKCSGSPDACAYTNNKVIVARSYVSQMAEGTDPLNPAADSMPDDYSPRDRMGHGTAAASCAAGNTNTGSVTFSGIAPKAYLGNYKIWGSPFVNEAPPESIWIQAIDDAFNDGMDIANMSSGAVALSGPLDTGATCGLAANVPCDHVAAEFERVAKAGMVIVASAGNDGFSGYEYPTFNSISSPATAPSVIAVGATTSSHVFAPSVKVSGPGVPSNLQNIPAISSDSYFYPSLFGGNAAPLIDVAQIGDGYACSTLPAGSLNGAFALIQRGPTADPCYFSAKADNVQTAGAVGAILYMAPDSPPLDPPYAVESVDQFFGPFVAISNADGVALKSYLATHPGQAVTIDMAGVEQELATYSQMVGFSPPVTSNQLASYSSFGPNPGDSAIKPDLVATGGLDELLYPDPNDGYLYAYSGMYTAAQKYDPLGGLYSSNGYAAANGTSFASPIVAGAAALVMQNHPTTFFKAALIKSALVNTAAQDVTVDDMGNSVDVEWLGAGRLDAGAATAAAVAAQVVDVPAPASPALATSLNFGALKTGSLPITKQIQVTNSGSGSVNLAVAIAQGTAASGTSLTVDKQSLTVAPGSSGTVNVTLSGSLPRAGSYSGAVTLQTQDKSVSLRVPYLFLVGTGVGFNVIPLFGGPDGTVGQDVGPIAIKIVDLYGVPVAGTPVTFTVSPRGSVTVKSAPGAPACSPASSTSSTSCATDDYGIAYAEVVLGSSPIATATVNVRALGLTFPFYGTIRQQPTIPTGGVVDAAKGLSPVAPGSYISIYGAGLSDYSDSATYLPLPLSLDAVTVSFDVPSAKISVPGHLVYVSSGQVNLQVPWELQGQTSAQVKVTLYQYSYGNVVAVPLADYAPALFEGGGSVAARDANHVQILPGHPAVRGQAISLYANGLGPVTNQPASGDAATSSPLAETKSTPVVMIGSQQAPVSFSGLAPGFPGLYQINVTVPSNVTPGNAAITVAIAGKTSRAGTLPVQ